MPEPFVLNDTLLGSPFFVLGGDGSLAIPGRDILVELDAYDIQNEELMTFYFGSRGYNNPTAPDYYSPRLEQPLNFRRDIFSNGTTGGASRVSFGEMRLANNDGALDFLKNYGIVGRPVRMLIGNVSEDYDQFEALIVGRVGRVLFNNADLTIQLRDRLLDFAKPIQDKKYAGTNVLPDGLEGVDVDDIKDRPKPLLFGVNHNFSPPCVNTSKLIYQINDGQIGTLLSQVYDNGVLLTMGADYSDQADLLNNEPDAGTYRVFRGGGYFRLGAGPTGTITCTAADADTDDNSAVQVATRIATRTPESGEGGIDSIDIDLDDVEVLDNLTGFTKAGIWVSGGETYAQALDAILGSIGAWYGFDRFGVLRMQRLDLPAAPYFVTFRIARLPDSPMALYDYPIVNYRFMPSNDPEGGQPTWRVSIDYLRNYTVQPGSVVAGSVTQETKNFLALAIRTEKRESTQVQDFYPLAVEKEISTLLVDDRRAGDEAERLLEIFSTPRDFLEIDTILRSDIIATIDIGTVVNVVLPRGDYTAGKVMRVIGMQYNAQAGILTLALWG